MSRGGERGVEVRVKSLAVNAAETMSGANGRESRGREVIVPWFVGE